MTTNFSRRQFILFGSAAFGTSLLVQACSSKVTTPTATTIGGAKGFKIAIALPRMITFEDCKETGKDTRCVKKTT
ncbi:MAG: hypothetical protein V7K18_25920 [Nostoc sp.]|uniref:hypothetical protein n=1 Tax=Nostoc sp. TaxID=1180 RepID=UPI002FF5F1A2